MREYALNLEKQGISHDRYQELHHFCLQYDALSQRGRDMIDAAAKRAAGQYFAELKKNICNRDMPYRFIDIPYSESQFKRMRRMFYVYLNETKEK